VDGWTWRDLRVRARAKLIILSAISSTLRSVSLSLKRVRVGMEFVWCSDLLLFRSKRSLNCMMVLSYVVMVSLCCGAMMFLPLAFRSSTCPSVSFLSGLQGPEV